MSAFLANYVVKHSFSSFRLHIGNVLSVKTLYLHRNEYLIMKEDIMLTYTYAAHGKFELKEKARPKIEDSRDAIVRVTLVASAPVTFISNMVVCRVQCLG